MSVRHLGSYVVAVAAVAACSWLNAPGGLKDAPSDGSGGLTASGGANVGGPPGGGGVCENLDSNPEHCGACGRACSAEGVANRACASGLCAPECAQGFGDCTTPLAPEPDDGCETDLRAFANQCGACGRVCSGVGTTERVCNAGECVPQCAAPYADCRPSLAPGADDGCETDLKSSATNCGRCGHDCLGAACLDGLCQPIVLATGEIDIFEVAVSGGFVLWTVRDAVRRVRTTGGAVETFDPSSAATNVVTTGTSVVWIDANSIKLKPLGTPSSAPRTLFEPEPGYDETVSGLAVNATGVFFALLNSVLTGETDRVTWYGGSAMYVGGDANNTRVLAVDDTYLYVQSLMLEATPIDGADAGAAIIIDQQRPVDIAVDATHVYWGTQDAIKRWQKPAGDVEFVATETAGVVSMAVDASSVYWSTADGQIRRAPKEGGAVETLLENQSSPRSVEVDDEAVYWANSGTQAENPSSVLKLAK